jgi:hypothetical protein
MRKGRRLDYDPRLTSKAERLKLGADERRRQSTHLSVVPLRVQRFDEVAGEIYRIKRRRWGDN